MDAVHYSSSIVISALLDMAFLFLLWQYGSIFVGTPKLVVPKQVYPIFRFIQVGQCPHWG